MRELSIKQHLGYGFLALPLALVAITFYVYVPKYYADVVGLDLALIGAVVLLSRIWDGVTDPVIGHLSDRTQSRFGRRRSWILISVIPLAIVFFLLLRPELSQSLSLSPAVWFAILTFLFFLFWTTVSVPYEALGAEVSLDYKERNTLFGWREGALVLGTLLAAVIPWLLEQPFSGVASDMRFLLIGLSYGLLLLFGAILCGVFVKERLLRSSQKPSSGIRESVSHVLSNKPFMVLLTSYTVSALGAALPATLILFYVEDVLGSAQGSAFLVLYFLIGFLCLPLWVRLAGKIGKKEAWIGAMLINTGAFSAVFFLGEGHLLAYGILVSLSAIGYGATLAIPSSMQADVIDFDELHHGTRKEGQFIGFWAIAKKFAAAIGAGLAFLVLDAVGYQAGAAEQSEATLFWLRFLYAGVPSLCNFVAILIALHYPLDQGKHEAIRREIDNRIDSPFQAEAVA